MPFGGTPFAISQCMHYGVAYLWPVELWGLHQRISNISNPMPTAAGSVRADFVIDLYISMVTYDRSDCLIYLACTQNKKVSIRTNIAEMNVFTKRLSATGIFHENHEHHGNYRVSIKLQEEMLTWRFCFTKNPVAPLGGTPVAISECMHYGVAYQWPVELWRLHKRIRLHCIEN
ncbi:hypothetical protein T4E_11156 [Trichinella pseudospiralis]|uniref:Uncharacterized protein n=1 Tax=Trichinella pseudospiralis TaxID=6337 RepID=A0A0V0XEP4_TRIPS|nr:hypothetical protein T4E_11156 [Trichinella pseudospiralis]